MYLVNEVKQLKRPINSVTFQARIAARRTMVEYYIRGPHALYWALGNPLQSSKIKMSPFMLTDILNKNIM